MYLKKTNQGSCFHSGSSTETYHEEEAFEDNIVKFLDKVPRFLQLTRACLNEIANDQLFPRLDGTAA